MSWTLGGAPGRRLSPVRWTSTSFRSKMPVFAACGLSPQTANLGSANPNVRPWDLAFTTNLEHYRRFSRVPMQGEHLQRQMRCREVRHARGVVASPPTSHHFTTARACCGPARRGIRYGPGEKNAIPSPRSRALLHRRRHHCCEFAGRCSRRQPRGGQASSRDAAARFVGFRMTGSGCHPPAVRGRTNFLSRAWVRRPAGSYAQGKAGARPNSARPVDQTGPRIADPKTRPRREPLPAFAVGGGAWRGVRVRCPRFSRMSPQMGRHIVMTKFKSEARCHRCRYRRKISMLNGRTLRDTAKAPAPSASILTLGFEKPSSGGSPVCTKKIPIAFSSGRPAGAARVLCWNATPAVVAKTFASEERELIELRAVAQTTLPFPQLPPRSSSRQCAGGSADFGDFNRSGCTDRARQKQAASPTQELRFEIATTEHCSENATALRRAFHGHSVLRRPLRMTRLEVGISRRRNASQFSGGLPFRFPRQCPPARRLGAKPPCIRMCELKTNGHLQAQRM